MASQFGAFQHTPPALRTDTVVSTFTGEGIVLDYRVFVELEVLMISYILLFIMPYRKGRKFFHSIQDWEKEHEEH